MLNHPTTAVIVTGAASGIGRATALALAEVGRSVAIWDLDAARSAAVAAECLRAGAPHAVGSAVDVTLPAAIEAGLREATALGVVGGLVHAAGVAVGGPVDALDDDGWSRVMNVNLRAFTHLVRIALPTLRAAGPGAAIVGVSSVEGWIGHKFLAAYCASKAGLLGLVRSYAHALARDGIRVNAVCPGLIRTPLTKDHFSKPEILKEYFRDIPLGRGGEASEVAAAALFLASDAASFITGATLLVDGGQMATKFGTWNEEMADFRGDRWMLR